MNIGFVYILLNPAFPNLIKIGRTVRDPQVRAKELSCQTGVPDDFIVLYDEMVSDAKKVEDILHNRFIAFRAKRNKEFFRMPPKEAIMALQEIAKQFPVPTDIITLRVELLSHFKRYFKDYIDPLIISIDLILMPGLCYLDICKQSPSDGRIVNIQEEVPLSGLLAPESPTLDDLRHNEALLKSCDAYDWIMISNLFQEEIASKIAEEWERPGGKKLDQKLTNINE